MGEIEEINDNPLGIDENSGLVAGAIRMANKDILRQYEISLKYLSKGMIIRVGCKEIAFSDNKEGLDALVAYVTNPYEESEKWHKILNE